MTGFDPESEAAIDEPDDDASAQPVQYLNTADVRLAPLGLIVPLTVALCVPTELELPVVGVGASCVVNEPSAVLHVVPYVFVAESLKKYFVFGARPEIESDTGAEFVPEPADPPPEVPE